MYIARSIPLRLPTPTWFTLFSQAFLYYHTRLIQVMISSRPRQGLLVRISQILLLAHLLVVAQGYPYGNSSVLSDEEQSEQSYLSKRASMSDFTTVPGFPTITKHISCDKKAAEANFWENGFQILSTMVSYPFSMPSRCFEVDRLRQY